jgi:hypothetical protein
MEYNTSNQMLQSCSQNTAIYKYEFNQRDYSGL